MGLLNNILVRIRGDSTSLNKSLDGAGKSVGGFKTKILGLGAAITGAVVGAFALWKRAMESTEGTMDQLELLTAKFKGGFQGLMQTIATGDWGGLIDNITKTAKAYRDLAAAKDLMEDVEASNVLKRSYLEANLQASRLAFASATDPALKAQYLSEAIAAQKAITDINISEINARTNAAEESYKTLMGFDEEASALMIQNIRKIAGNYETFYGAGGQAEALRIQKASYAYKDQLGILTDVEKAHYRLVQAAVANLDVFDQLQNNMKPGLFREYVKDLGAYNNAIAEGDQAIYRLTKALTGLEDKLSDIKKIAGPSIAPIAHLGIPQIGSAPGAEDILAPGPKMPSAKDYTDEWENTWNDAIQNVTDFMSEAFIGVFERIGSGSFAGFGKELLQNFGQLISQLGKMLMSLGTTMLLALTLLKVPTIPTAIAAIAAGAAAMAIGGLMMGAASRGGAAMSGGGSSGGYSPNMSPQNMKVIVEGKIMGKDIYISNKRYINELGQNT